MIDYIFGFDTEEAAQTDPAIGAYYDNGWNLSVCNPGVLVWNPADNTTGERADGSTYPIQNPIDTLWRIGISLPEQVAALDESPACEIVADRDTNEVLQTTFTPEQLQTLWMQPVFAGSNYPFLQGQGGLS